MAIKKTRQHERLTPRIGAHMSIAGGYFRAVERAAAAGCDCVQLFTKNNNQWRARPIEEDDVTDFRQALDRHRIDSPLSHASYLINLASPDRDLWRKSVDSMTVELQRAERLGLIGVVLHPGAAVGATESSAIRRIVQGLNRAMRQAAAPSTRCLLETTAGQGSSIGCRFEQLGRILDNVVAPERFGVCFDTCHVFAAGYPLRTAIEYADTMGQFDRILGLDRILAFHLNDSKTPFGSRVDRHQHIGRGTLGLDPFRRLLTDPRFQGVPMYVETPKGIENGRDLDRINLARLRRLCRG